MRSRRRAALGWLGALALVALSCQRAPSPEATSAPAEGEAASPPQHLDDGTLPAAPPPARAAEAHPEQVPVYPTSWSPPGLPAAPLPPPGAFDGPWVRGFAVGAHLELPGLPWEALFAEIAEHGATHVSIVVAWSQANIRAVDIHPDPVETLPDAELRRMIQAARAAKLQVILFPILHLERRRPGEWRGRLAPALPALWWASYREFLLHYAVLAAEEEVDILSVGSELLDLEGERARWLEVIAAVRGVFGGRLIYSANWDHFDGVSFWDALDLVGMTGYFELSQRPAPTLDELRSAWSAGADVIAGYGRRVGKPVLLTEVGYPSQVGAAAHPWDYTRRRAFSAEAQYLAFRGMYEAYHRRAEAGEVGLGGVLVWSWYGYGGPGDLDYTPRGKPASALLRRWFKGE